MSSVSYRTMIAFAFHMRFIEAPNFSLQRTAGLRFSQFLAQWPAAAEFRC
jgi:hypothetical protein